MNLTIFAYYYAVVAVGIALIILATTLPAITREGNVRNGLAKYRKIFLVSGWSIFFLAAVTEFILVSRLIVPLDVYREMFFVLIISFSTSILVIAIAKHKMYTFNFTEENKKFHAALEEEEKGGVYARSKKRSKSK